MIFLSLADPGVRVAADNAQKRSGKRQYRAALARTKRAIRRSPSRQGVTNKQNPRTGDHYLRDAERLRAEWREASLRLALQKYRSATKFFRKERDKTGEAKARVGAGDVLSVVGEHDEAMIQYKHALNLIRAATDKSLEVDTLNKLTEVEIEKRVEIDEAHARRALDVSEQAGYKLGQAGALKNLGVIAYTRRDIVKAVDYFNRALSLWQSEGDHAGQAEALTNLGFTYGDSGDVNRARECFDKALDLAKTARHAQKEARIALAIGLVHTVRGEWQKALDRYQRTALILDQIGDRATQAIAFNGLGYLYSELGEASKSLESFKKSLYLSRIMGHRGREALTLSHIADLYADNDRQQQALRIYWKLIPIARRLRDAKIEAYALNKAGAVYESVGALKRASRCYHQALTLARTVNHPRVQAYSLDHLGTLYLRTRRYTDAHVHYQEALSLMRRAGDFAGELVTLYNVAKLKQAEGKIDDALKDIESVIRAAESLRSEVISSDLRASYFASAYRRYELLIDLFMQKHAREPASGYDVAAFEACERGRARSLTEMLIESRANILEGAPSELLERERTLSNQLAKKADEEMALRETKFKLQKNRQIKPGKRAEELSQNSREIESVIRDIAELSAKHDQAKTEITAASPQKYSALLRAQPISLKQIQSEILDPETLVIAYSLGEERSYLWLVGRASLNSYVLPGKAEIEREAYRFYNALTSISRANGIPLVSNRTQANARIFSASREWLSRTLLAPIEGSIGSKRLLIVPDGALQYVAFAALVEPYTQKPLAVAHEIATVQSLSALWELRKEEPGRPGSMKTLAVFADPVVEDRDPRFSEDKTATELRLSRRSPGVGRAASVLEGARDSLSSTTAVDGAINLVRLVFTAEEANVIAALLPESDRIVLSGFDANRQNVTSDDLSNFRIIHFATHGLLNFRHPKLSCLVLSRFDRARQPRDGYLRLQDIYNMRLSADLVVLSACQTALGKDVRGEGLVGLTRGFMYAGARRVVASLWNVDDSATANLMERFYRKMLGTEKLAPAAALRAAQVEMMQEERWRDPFFWAGFILQGDWK